MTGEVLMLAYALVGLGAATFVLIQRSSIAGLSGLAGALVMLVFWPFLLPLEAFGEPEVAKNAPGGRRGERIAKLARRMREALEQLPDDAAPRRARERAELDAFVGRLHALDRRLADLEAAELDAPPGVKEKLADLKAKVERELEDNLRLLDEVVAQLTLLRFSDLRGAQERGGVEDLLLRVESQNQAADVAEQARVA